MYRGIQTIADNFIFFAVEVILPCKKVFVCVHRLCLFLFSLLRISTGKNQQNIQLRHLHIVNRIRANGKGKAVARDVSEKCAHCYVLNRSEKNFECEENGQIAFPKKNDDICGSHNRAKGVSRYTSNRNNYYRI